MLVSQHCNGTGRIFSCATNRQTQAQTGGREIAISAATPAPATENEVTSSRLAKERRNSTKAQLDANSMVLLQTKNKLC